MLDIVRTRTHGLQIRGGRVTPAAQWHLTLQFLGDDADIDAVVSALDGFDVRGGRVRLGGAGAFPNARRGRILWIGMAEGADVLERLAGGVARQLTPLGFQPEARSFVPHLTLVRCAGPTDLRAAVAALGAEAFGASWAVEELTVYESQLRDDGPRYIERARIPLPR